MTKDKTDKLVDGKKETEAQRLEREKREQGQALGEIYPNPAKDNDADKAADDQKGYHGSADYGGGTTTTADAGVDGTK